MADRGSWPDRWQRLQTDLEARSPDLADLVGLVATNAPGSAAAAGYRAALDARLALLAAETADRNARAAEHAANRLTAATWTLVAVTVVLVIVTVVMGLS